MIDLERLIRPLGFEEFIDQVFEKKALKLQHDQQLYDEVLTVDELSAFLSKQTVFYPAVRLVKDGKELDKSLYTYDKLPYGHQRVNYIIDIGKMMTLFNGGATIVVQSGQRIFDHLSTCCRNISETLGAQVQANIYITPPGKKGFRPHWDTHDVIVLHIHGEKSWDLYDFDIQLPLKTQGYRNAIEIKSHISERLILKKGDFLYIPRGYVHDAATENAYSIHITIGILQTSWYRVLETAFESFKKEVLLARKSIPFWDDNLITDQFEQLKQSFTTYLDRYKFEETLDQFVEKRRTTQPQLLNNYFGSVLKLEQINEHTIFHLNENLDVRIEESDDKIRLIYLHKTIAFPAQVKPALEHLFQKKSVGIGDLTEFLSASSSEVLLRKLVKEGLISIK